VRFAPIYKLLKGFISSRFEISNVKIGRVKLVREEQGK